MFAARSSAPPPPAFRPLPVPRSDVDQRVILYGVSWRDYSVMRELFDSPSVRLTYLKGALEIMSPSRLHEDVKTRLARFLELYALECDIRMYGYGSMTLRRQEKERGLEPDECYVFGKPQTEGFPDLAIEVVATRGGLDKLAVYQGLGVREVWIWDEGRIDIHALEASGYEPRATSMFLPKLDRERLARLLEEPDPHEALKAFRDELRNVVAR